MTTQSKAGGWAALWRKQRFTVLLGMLVVDILIAPTIGVLGSAKHPNLGAGVIVVSLTGVVIAALLAISQERKGRRAALGFGVVMIVLAWLDLASDMEVLFWLSQSLTTLFLAFVVALLIRHVFSQRRVTLDVVNASLCAYILLGLAWAAAYSLIEIWQPGSFRVPEDGFPFSGQDVDAGVRRVYFSFVTLLTLGYGEITPAGSLARMSAVMEAFVGQVFLVVLIARLVGIHVGQEMTESFEDDQEAT